MELAPRPPDKDPERKHHYFGGPIREAIETIRGLRRRREERLRSKFFARFARDALEDIEARKRTDKPESES